MFMLCELNFLFAPFFCLLLTISLKLVHTCEDLAGLDLHVAKHMGQI